MRGGGCHWKGRGIVGEGVGLLHPFHGAARRMVLWFSLGKHRALWGRGSVWMAVTMATVARLKGARPTTRLVDDALMRGQWLAGVGEGVGNDTERLGAGLCKGRGVGLSRRVARWSPQVGRFHHHGSREGFGHNCRKCNTSI